MAAAIWSGTSNKRKVAVGALERVHVEPGILGEEGALGKGLRVEPANRRFVDELPGFPEIQVIGIAKDVISDSVL